MYRSPFFYFSLAVEPTNRCNFACLHCARANNIADTQDLPLALYEKFLREARSYQTPSIALTGGEPTLHPDFEALLDLTTRYQYFYTLMTNGWTFEQIYPIISRYRANLTAVYFSLDGVEEATHDTIRQQPGAYRRVLQACALCHYKQIPFHLTMTLHRLNMNEIEGVLQLASRLGAEAVHVGSALLTRNLVAHNLAYSPEEGQILGEKLLSIDENPYIPTYPTMNMLIENPCFPCVGIQMSTLLLDYKGRLRFCCHLPRDEHDDQDHQPDVVGSLDDSSLWELHRRLVQKTAQFQEARIQRIESQPLTLNEHFPCYYCAKYFGKLDWLKEFPESPWNF